MRNNTEQPQFLCGWKEIATYLGKGVRTVQRYERDFGLPVRRPAGKDSGSVIATKRELDAWVTASPIRKSLRLTRAEASLTDDAKKCLRQGVAEMIRLRQQMGTLGEEVRISLQLLNQSLRGLQRDLEEDQFRRNARITVLEAHQRNRNAFDLLASDSRVKAS